MACRAETRSQGIATDRSGSRSPRGCGPLQSRDPFSGDCDGPVGPPVRRRRRSGLQSRDPFSGDCDADEPAAAHPAPPGLAEPRPVLRGLRHVLNILESAKAELSCRAETRSQGIATRPATFSAWWRSWPACRAETRSQGIATRKGRVMARLGLHPLAEPRPVLRGLRPLESTSGLLSAES